MSKHEMPIRVFYEDTDMAGIVYYANYLKFIERGRSTMVREAGVDQHTMKEAGVVFVVRRVEADYLSTARLDDELTVATEMQQLSGVKLLFKQQVLKGEKLLFSADVTVVCMSLRGRPIRLPAPIAQKLENFSAEM